MLRSFVVGAVLCVLAAGSAAAQKHSRSSGKSSSHSHASSPRASAPRVSVPNASKAHRSHVASGSTHHRAETSVRRYTRKKGTIVAPHVRTTPNGTRRDNYSMKGNVNPHTGKAGTNSPVKP
ncbi:MAG TPA: hypothetical protein VGM82_24625 [Gemmatimonadaceae bacterium]|jgi:pyruvate/2-oxoglutarate dehydrogenase complex dihydrolipoamide acyltransferase (E2) component